MAGTAKTPPEVAAAIKAQHYGQGTRSQGGTRGKKKGSVGACLGGVALVILCLLATAAYAYAKSQGLAP